MTDVRDWAESDYSRIYHAIFRDPKFAKIRSDERLFGAYGLILVFADMTYPNPTPVPAGVSKGSVKALVDAGVVEVDSGLCTLPALVKERSARFGSGRGRPRYPSDQRPPRSGPDGPSPGDGTGAPPEPPRSPVGGDAGAVSESSRRESEAHARGRTSGSVLYSVSPVEGGVGEDPLDAVERWLSERHIGAAPGSSTHTTLVRLVDQHGAPAVIAAFVQLAADNPGMRDAAQWVFGVRKYLNPIPGGPSSHAPHKGQTGSGELERAVERV